MDWSDSQNLERLVTPAEMARLMVVDQAHVFRWIETGDLDVQRGEDGDLWVRIDEHRQMTESATGAGSIEARFTSYPGLRDPQLLANARAERRERERDAEIAATAATGVDIDALTAGLAHRLAAVAPALVQITTERGLVDVQDVRGGGGALDIALVVATFKGDTRSPTERVVNAGQRLLETAQEEIAQVVAEPWPLRGPAPLPLPHAELSPDGATVRLFYGTTADPVLELAPLPVARTLLP